LGHSQLHRTCNRFCHPKLGPQSLKAHNPPAPQSHEGQVTRSDRDFNNHDSSIDLDKPIFTLSVASEILEVHPRTLMMYEHLSMIHPKRTVTNRRRYSRRDVMKLQAIQTLTREHHVNLAGVRYILALLKRLHNAGVEPRRT
jgi:hypothetical protein